MDTLQSLWAEPLVKYYLSAFLAMIPVARIFIRAGLRPFATAFLLVPWFGVVIVLGVLACNRWPTAPAKAPKKAVQA